MPPNVSENFDSSYIFGDFYSYINTHARIRISIYVQMYIISEQFLSSVQK